LLEHPETTQNLTVEDFANWLLALPSDIRKKQIWYIDIGMQYKGKPLLVDTSPSGTHICIEEDLEDKED
jgi:hypothetical protein